MFGRAAGSQNRGPIFFGLVQNAERFKRVLQNAVPERGHSIGNGRNIGVHSWRAFSFLEAFMIAPV
jgi:hypothetical protein